MTNSKVYRKILAAASVVAGLGMQGLGADGTWLGTQNNVWVNNANWSGSTYPGDATGQTATFDGGGNGFSWLDLAGLSSVKNIGFVSGSVAGYTLGVGGVNAQTLVMEANGLMTMDSAVTATQRVDAAIQLHTTTSLSQHNFKNNSVSYPLVLNGNIAGAPSGGTPGTKTISVDGDGGIIVGGNISAGGANAAKFIKSGQGTLTLAGANVFNANNEYYGGTIRMAHPQAYTGSGLLLIRTPPPGGIIEFAHDESNETPFSMAVGILNNVGNTATLVSGAGTGSAGRNYTVGTLGISGTSMGVARSEQVTTGTPSITIQTVDLNGSGTECTLIPSTADLYVGNITISANSQHKTIVLDGTSAGSRVDGVIDNGIHTISLIKSNSGTWTLLGANVYTGTTSVAGGTLKLAGTEGSILTTTGLSFNNGTLLLDNSAGANRDRLPDAVPISLAAATLQFTHAGGAANYSESGGPLIVKSGSITVSASRADVGQTSTLTFSELVYEGGTVNFTGEGLGEDGRNRIVFTNPPALEDGIIGQWATVNGTALATYGPNGITAYTPSTTTDIAARGPASVIPDDATAHVRIIDDGAAGPITLAEDDTAVASLTQANADYAATVDTAGRTLRAASVAIGAGAEALTVGAAAGDGTLTALSAGGALSFFSNNPASPLTVNADIADNGTASLLSAIGDGTVMLRGGILHTGDIVVNNASLVLDRSADQIVSNTISGTGALVKEGTNYLHLLGESTYTGPTYINAGIVRPNADTTFGTPDGGVFIAEGATLDIGCSADVGGTRVQDSLTFGTQLFTVSGTGVDGNGVIVNNSSIRQINAFSRIELADNATFGGISHWRMQNNLPTLVMNGHTLTKAGPNMIELNDCNVTPGDGHINVAAGILRPLYATEFNGSATNTITVQAGAQLALYRIANPQLWSIILADGSTLVADTADNDTHNRWAGPVQLNGNVTFSGSGAADLRGLVSGEWPVVKSDTGRFVFSGTNNTYTGQTRIEGGTLAAASLRNVGEASSLGQPVDAADGTIIVGSSGAGGTLEYVGTGDTSDRVISMGGSTSFKHSGSGLLKFISSLAVSGSGDRIVKFMGNASEPGGEFAGNIANVGGSSVEVQKLESGRWLLSGTNSFGGSLLINGGELAVSGVIDHGEGNVLIGTASGGSGILRVLPGAIFSGASPAFESCRFIIGSGTGADGALYMEGGTLIREPSGNSVGFALAHRNNYGHFNMSGGEFSSTRLHMGGYDANNPGGRSVIRMKGGTMTFTEFMLVGRYPGDVAVINVEGGTLDHAAGSYPLAIGFDGGRGEVNVIGGTLDNTAQTITVRQKSGNGIGVVSLCYGTLITKEIIRSNVAGSVWLNFAGGTLKAAAAASAFVPVDINGVYTFGAFGDFTGGAVIDTDGHDVTVAAAVQAPACNGVYAIAVASKGEGYLGEPYVSIRGGGGVGAAAIANMEPDGNGRYRVSSITVTSPGSGFTETPTVTLEMGGYSTAATLGAITMQPNVSGGLTKTGTGTLTLSAANTYQGATKVSSGTLKLANAKALPTDTEVVLDGGTLDLSGYTVTNQISGSGVLANGTMQATISPAGEVVIGSSTFTLDGADVQGLYMADVTADGASDFVTFQSGVDLDGWTLQLVDPQLLNRQHAYTVMSCAGGRVGKLTLSNPPDFRWHVVYGVNGSVMLKFTNGTLISVK